MSVLIFLRLSFMFVLALVGWKFGFLASGLFSPFIPPLQWLYQTSFAIIGLVIGFVGAPYISIVPYRLIRRGLRLVSVQALIMGIVGLILGLITAALLAIPLSMLPGMWGQVMPFVAAMAFGVLGVMAMVIRDRDILNGLGLVIGRDGLKRRRSLVLLDTSVIIDGRVADIRRTGFIRGTMIVPRFVLDELQHIADSADALRRNRGRRGLDILNEMQKDDIVPLEISERDVPEIREVDGKLVRLAQDLDCPVLTNDYNLNRVAGLQGVQIMNINELANAVKAVVLPGETLQAHIIQEGKEPGQGVAYLDDGTMIVVEDGRRYLNMAIEIVVTRVLQTVAGRMIFGQIQEAGRR